MFPNELLNYRDKSYKTVFRSIIMKPVRILFAATCFAPFVFVVAVCLHEYLYSFDPYQWAFPGVESDMSRSLWLHRRDKYRMVDFISFILAMVFGFMTLAVRRRKQ